MPLFLWILAGMFGSSAAGFLALRLHLRRTRVSYPPPETLVTEPEVDLALTRDTEGGAFHLHWHGPGIAQAVYVSDHRGEDGPALWEAAADAPDLPPAFTLDAPPTRPLFTLQTTDGDRFHAAERELPLEGAVNFRDIGGYRTHDGRHVRWNRIFRAGKLDGLTTTDQRTLHTLGLRTVCDLRSSDEVAEAPDNLHEYGGIAYHHMEVLTDRDASQRERLRALLFERERLSELMPKIYTQVGLEHNATLNGDLLRMMADPANLPLVFHCTAGKDRTGVVTALLLLALGVPEETVIADYSLSNRHFATFREYGADAVRPVAFLGINAADIQPLLVSDPANMRAMIAYIHEHYGSAKAYLNDRAGVDSHTIEALQMLLLA